MWFYYFVPGLAMVRPSPKQLTDLFKILEYSCVLGNPAPLCDGI